MLTIVKLVPAVWTDGVPELPLPDVKVSPGSVMINFVTVPATSVSVPKFVVPAVTPVIVDVPDFVIFAVASGDPAVGRIRTFCHVSEFVTPLLLTSVTVNVICVDVTEPTATLVPPATLLMFRVSAPTPPVLVTHTVGNGVVVSNANPEGAFRMIVPVPAFPLDVSV